MFVISNGVVTSFIEREHDKEISNQLLPIRIEAERVTGQLNRLVVTGVLSKMSNDGQGRLDENRMQPLAFFQNPVSLLSIQERSLVSIKDRKDFLDPGGAKVSFRAAEYCLRGLKKRPGVDVKPSGPFQDGLKTHGS